MLHNTRCIGVLICDAVFTAEGTVMFRNMGYLERDTIFTDN